MLSKLDCKAITDESLNHYTNLFMFGWKWAFKWRGDADCYIPSCG